MDATDLLTPPGQELLARLTTETAGSALALGTKLRREYPPGLVALAITQHELRGLAAAKFERADQMLFTRPGLEQASAEPVARHRARRLAGVGRLADLCCGIGGDLIALAGDRLVVAVDRDPVHAKLAEFNAGVYNCSVTALVADVRGLKLAGVDGVFIDPARRGQSGRFRPGHSEPPLAWCLALAGPQPGAGRPAVHTTLAPVEAVAIKAAPGLPLDVVPPGWEVEFIADGRDLKEATLWSPALATTTRRATILPAGDTLVPDGLEGAPVAMPGEYLLDPNPAVTRAGLVQDLARQLDAWQIDPKIAFLATDRPVTTPFARTLRVLHSAPWNEKRFAGRLRELGIGAADLRRRGLAGDVDLIHRRLKLSGPNRATVVLTRVNDQPWGLICGFDG